MANAFSVCSLAQTWQIATTKDGTYVDIADPSWITALNALAIAFALISNLALSLNMARRVRFGIAQPVIIVGWYLSSLLLIGQLIAFDVLTHRPENSGHIYTQAYFYGAFAAGIYFIIASMLVMTAYGAHRGYYSREYKLTTSQRTLMLQTITFCIYLLGGAAVYSKIEGWRFLDAVWWADYTLLTVGVGNFVPITHLGRGLLFPYAIGGIVILGLIISSIRRLMLEYGRQKVADALTARTRRFLVKEAFSDHHHLRGLVPHLGRSDVELSDREQQKREFITMRRIRQLATAQHKWISLVVSMAVWMMIWLVGAVVFWRSEHNLRWSYFDALFFAYTTLLTIGYGNRSPVSNLGKSFFVIWSLLAVPITTILISNLGDTLIRLVRDTTLFIGEVTILPGDQSFSARIRDMFRISWTDKWLQEITGERNDTQDVLDNNEPDSLQVESDVRGSMEAEEHKKEETAHQLGDVAAENVHHYHYLLFREIRKMMEYATSNLSKEFDYLEWEYYLALISGKQRPVPADVDASAAGETESVDRERELAYKEWSWIDKKNPLLGGKSEVEWLLHALTDALERELRTASRAYHSPAASDEGDQGSGFASSSSGSGV
ncbi:hypothetical protein N7492_007634 [Penicillium capsulatum]|uniref:Potassium channel domain-containing protein n=1 Tax=Penicillium capsulatum TaxID=69766 RepID=A0A9W9LL16_9EURO|nr:hypothetical protein N7492_007634 [Penicillium capsulatum]